MKYINGEFITDDILTAPLDDDSIHLIVTSPPYNVGIDYDLHEDNQPYEEYIDWLSDVFLMLKDKLVDGGRVCINIAPTGIKNFKPIHHDLITNLRKGGYHFLTEILWYKQNIKKRTAWGSFRSPRRPYILPSWEYVYVMQKGECLEKDSEAVKPDITADEFVRFSDGFWQILPEKEKNGHPVPFPWELVYRLVKFYTYPGNTVLDPFGGSGTVAAVCADTGRDFIYVDISEDYTRLAKAKVGEIMNNSNSLFRENAHSARAGKIAILPIKDINAIGVEDGSPNVLIKEP
ncbi:MAG: site-specific DNA-methyltransferase [Methanomicrobiales archaeon]|jgi:DNA modification methylase